MDFIFSIPQSQMFTFNGGTTSIPLTVNTPGIYITEINDTIENGIYIRLGYKDTSWFTSNPTFVLKSGEHVYNSDNGQYKIGDGTTELQDLIFYGGQSSTASNITADNGLTLTADNIQLGGTLIQQTSIDLDGNVFNISDSNTELDLQNGDVTISGNLSISLDSSDVTDTSSIYIQPDSLLIYSTEEVSMVVVDGFDVSGIDITKTPSLVPNNGVNNMIITDNILSKGFVYFADYSSNFTPESLITKRYLTNYVATASSNISANNGLTVSGNNVQLGGKLIQDTTILGEAYQMTIGSPASPLDSFTMKSDNDIRLYVSTGDVRLNSQFGAISAYGSGVNIVADSNIVISSTNSNVTIDADNGTISIDSTLHTNRGTSVVTNRTTSNLIQITEVGTSITNNGSNNNFIITDNVSSKGMVYASDYRSNFTPESLVSKRYTDFRFLPLTGGTMQGSIRYPQGTGVDFYNAAGTTLESGITWNGNTTFFLGFAPTQTLYLGFDNISIAVGSGAGAIYTADYSAGFVNESLITKRYVDTRIAASASTPSLAQVLIVGSSSGTQSINMNSNKIINLATGSNVLDAINYGQMSNVRSESIIFGVDGGGGTVLSGQIKGYYTSTSNGILTGYAISGSTAGTATFDVWKSSNGALPTVANTITDGFKPIIGSSSYLSSTGLTGWGITYSVGDIFATNIDSIAAFTFVSLQLNKRDFL